MAEVAFVSPGELFKPVDRSPVSCRVDGCRRKSSWKPICDHHCAHAPGWLYGALLVAGESGNREQLEIAAERITRWYAEASLGARLRRLVTFSAIPRRVPCKSLSSMMPRAIKFGEPVTRPLGVWIDPPRPWKMNEYYFRNVQVQRCMIFGCDKATTGLDPLCRTHFRAAPAKIQGWMLFGRELGRSDIIFTGGAQLRSYLSKEAEKPAPVRLARRIWTIVKGTRSTAEVAVMLAGWFAGAALFTFMAFVFMAMEPSHLGRRQSLQEAWEVPGAISGPKSPNRASCPLSRPCTALAKPGAPRG